MIILQRILMISTGEDSDPSERLRNRADRPPFIHPCTDVAGEKKRGARETPGTLWVIGSLRMEAAIIKWVGNMKGCRISNH